MGAFLTGSRAGLRLRFAKIGAMIFLRRMIICAAALACVAYPLGAFAQAPATVDAPAGVLEGNTEGALNVFKGVPYAMPPVAEGRWRPPVQMARWQGVRRAAAFGAVCSQPRRALGIYTQELGEQSEDCLTLNIWAPAQVRGAPVLIWFHGGAFTTGASSEQLFDGTRMASQGVIVVTVNSRLGVLGYLAHPELSAESPLGVSGNYGLLDQIEALRWVHNNIAAFGGDAANVTMPENRPAASVSCT
jgi:para-nitrobenzyl esterase